MPRTGAAAARAGRCSARDRGAWIAKAKAQEGRTSHLFASPQRRCWELCARHGARNRRRDAGCVCAAAGATAACTACCLASAAPRVCRAQRREQARRGRAAGAGAAQRSACGGHSALLRHCRCCARRRRDGAALHLRAGSPRACVCSAKLPNIGAGRGVRYLKADSFGRPDPVGSAARVRRVLRDPGAIQRACERARLARRRRRVKRCSG